MLLPIADGAVPRLLLLPIAGLLLLAILFAVSVVLLRAAHDRQAARTAALRISWEPLLLEILSGDRSTADLATRVGAGSGLPFLRLLLEYARRIRGPEHALLVELARPHVGLALRRLRSRRAERRAEAVELLSTLAMPACRPAVVRALDDRSPYVAMLAARALLARRDLELAREVLDRIERFRVWSTEFLAANLARVGPALGPELRIRMLDAGMDPRARAAAAHALAKLNDLAAADEAAAILSHENDPELLAAGLRILQATGQPRHVPTLHALTASPVDFIRAQAAAALGAVGGGPTDVRRLQELVGDDEPWVALNAARALASLEAHGALRAMAASPHPRAHLARELLESGS